MDNTAMPQMYNSTYTGSNTYDWNDINTFSRRTVINSAKDLFKKDTFGGVTVNDIINKEPKEVSNLRIVSVYIVDADENLDADKAILHVQREFLTTLTDQELFFEIDMKSILAKHNGYRQTVKDKKASKVSDRDIMLEPISYKDLKMNVVEIAKF
jgi:hypothetical protein